MEHQMESEEHRELLVEDDNHIVAWASPFSEQDGDSGVVDIAAVSKRVTPQILRWKSIEAFLEFSKSPNAKNIVADGVLPTN